jgi:raffinose synthase
VITKERRQTPGIYAVQPTIDEWFGLRVSTPLAQDAPLLFAALHGYLKAEGADAIKVDFQSTLEGICQGEGGRVDYDRAWRSALEDSSSRCFADGLINCMSCSSECMYLGQGSSLVRTSDDYYPNKPESHGLHLHTNAQMGMWFGEFIQPDWDMFQSCHPFAGYHAAGRALSGGPLLITDEVGKHDPAVIRRLVLGNGRALLADHPGRPSPDSLYVDPTRQSQVLKIFNRAGGAGLVGMFHAKAKERLALETELSARDCPGLEDREVVAFLHHRAQTRRLRPGQSIPVSLEHGGHEMAVLAPVQDGLAMLGLGDRYCASAALCEIDDRGGIYRARCQGGGPLMAWSEHAPRRVEVDGVAVDWQWDAASGIGSCPLPEHQHAIEIHR